MTRFHVSANWQTPSGGFGNWSGEVSAETIEQAMADTETKLRSDKRRGVIRALDMSAQRMDK
jgi:hypothetical protein